MAEIKTGKLNWDINELARTMKIDKSEVVEYFTDGRRVSFVIEVRLSKEFFSGQRAPSEGASFDILDSKGLKWESRSISKDVYFCPSYMVGSGRIFSEKGFLEKLDEIEGYVLSDISKFPEIPFYIINKEIIKEWYSQKKLGNTTKISRDRIISLIEKNGTSEII